MSTAKEPTPADSMIGRVLLDRYRVVRELARGGMGVVYLARMEGAAGFVKPVVLKLILSEFATNDRYLEMFRREAQILSQLRDPSIVDVIEFGEEGGDYIMVLEYVRGYHLGQWNRYLQRTEREVPTHVAIQIMIDVLQALHHAHNAAHPDGTPMQIVHRDVSPSNILLDSNGRGRLIDFGVARVRDAEATTKTDPGFVGKLTYTAPEVAQGKPASPRSDLYACGVVLHEVLLGFNTFRARTQALTLERVLTHVPESLTDVRDDVPEGFQEVLSRALEKRPERRYEDAGQMAAALRELQATPEWAIRDELAALVKRDFGVDMANMLELDTLEARDEAVRALVLAGSPTPHTQRGRASEQTQLRRRLSDSPPTVPYGPLKVHTPTMMTLDEDDKPAVRVWQRPPVWGAMVAVALMVGALFLQPGDLPGPVAAAVPVKVVATPLPSPTEAPTGTHPAQDTESETGTGTETKTETGIETGTAAEPEAKVQDSRGVAEKRNAKAPRGRPHKSDEPDPASLTRAFRKQQGRIHACFKDHGSGEPTHPHVDVDFSLTAHGKLERVTLQPSSVETTPLGKCLMAVARSTRFPAQGEPVSFTIPVTARRVRR